MLIEILVSAMVLTVASIGVIAVLQTTTHTQAELRSNSEAYALAQEDQARLASMRLGALNNLNSTRAVTVGSTTFQVQSRGVFINDNTRTPSCGEGTSSADYVEITSNVTWNGMDPGKEAKIVSILSPSNGSLDPNNGTLAFAVKTQPQAPVPNIYISGGSGAFSGYTDAFGCAVFADLPAGNYTATVSGEADGLVNRRGEYVQKETVSVVGGDTKTVNYEFDRPGTIPVTFRYRVGSSSTEYTTTKAPSVVVFNPGMNGGTAKAIWAPGAQPVAELAATPLFPFSSTYYLYAGSCSSNDPEPTKNPGAAAATANAVAPVGGTANPVMLQLPALEFNVKNDGSAVSGARLTVTDANCTNPQGGSVRREYTSNSRGQPSDSPNAYVGLPWGRYELCASARISGGDRRKRTTVDVKNLASATVATIDLRSGYESNRTCP